MARITKTRKPQALPETPLESLLLEHLSALAVKNYSAHTVRNRRIYIGFFLEWCKERGLTDPVEVTRPVLERYQRHLFHYRKKNGEPLSFRSQHSSLVPLRAWFRWMTRQNHILHNPASELELPRLGRSLPKNIFSAQEVERVMQVCEIEEPIGLTRPRHPRNALLDRDAAHGGRAVEAVRSATGSRPDPDPAGQGPQGPLCSYRRAGDSVASESISARAVRSWPSSRTT